MLCLCYLTLALQQFENILLRRFGLGQHRGCGLVEDSQFGQLRGLKRKVCVLNTASGCQQIGGDVCQVVDRVAQAVRDGPQLRALDVHRCYSCVDLGYGSPRAVT